MVVTSAVGSVGTLCPTLRGVLAVDHMDWAALWPCPAASKDWPMTLFSALQPLGPRKRNVGWGSGPDRQGPLAVEEPSNAAGRLRGDGHVTGEQFSYGLWAALLDVVNEFEQLVGGDAQRMLGKNHEPPVIATSKNLTKRAGSKPDERKRPDRPQQMLQHAHAHADRAPAIRSGNGLHVLHSAELHHASVKPS